MSISPEFFMHLALKKARQGLEMGQSPFGACIVKGDSVISCAHNRVWENTDITAHAEILAIREACLKLKTIDLSGCSIYSTCEPCPMCFCAIHWAKIEKVIFGVSIQDALDMGFKELGIPCEKMKEEGKSPVEVQGGFLVDEVRVLLDDWKKDGVVRVY